VKKGALLNSCQVRAFLEHNRDKTLQTAEREVTQHLNFPANCHVISELEGSNDCNSIKVEEKGTRNEVMGVHLIKRNLLKGQTGKGRTMET
jgi:hypothetical protein